MKKNGKGEEKKGLGVLREVHWRLAITVINLIKRRPCGVYASRAHKENQNIIKLVFYPALLETREEWQRQWEQC